jgi:hypothetical protein
MLAEARQHSSHVPAAQHGDDVSRRLSRAAAELRPAPKTGKYKMVKFGAAIKTLDAESVSTAQ